MTERGDATGPWIRQTPCPPECPACAGEHPHGAQSAIVSAGSPRNDALCLGVVVWMDVEEAIEMYGE